MLQVLVDLGAFVRAAAPALDYEVGRVISDVDRPLGEFPNNLSWLGAGIRVDPQLANAWIAAGEAARGDRPSAAMQQRALAALLRPIAGISCHSWLHDLVDALDALRFGEVHEIVAPSRLGLHGYRQGRTTWQTRLHALAWAEFQYRANLMKKTDALGEVASACGIRDVGSVEDWKRKAQKLFGEEVVQETLLWAGAEGKRYRSVQEQLASGKLEKSAVAREIAYFHRVFGRDRLEIIAGNYKAQARKRAPKKDTNGGVTRRP